MASVPPETEALVSDKPMIATLTTTVDDRPHAVPIWYFYEDGSIYHSTSAESRKVANVERNDRVAVSIQRNVDGTPIWMVLFRGRAAPMADLEAARDISERMKYKYLGEDKRAWTDHYRDSLDRIERGESVVLEVDIGSSYRNFSHGVDPEQYLVKQIS